MGLLLQNLSAGDPEVIIHTDCVKQKTGPESQFLALFAPSAMCVRGLEESKRGIMGKGEKR